MCIRWGSNPRLRRDWGLNPTPSWLVVDERPTRPRIQMCGKDFVRDSDRVRTRIDLVRIDPATLAGVDFKSTALTTRPHYLAQVQSAERPMRESNPRPSDFPVRPVSRRRRPCVHPVGFEPTPPKRLGLKSNALDQLGHGYKCAERTCRDDGGVRTHARRLVPKTSA